MRGVGWAFNTDHSQFVSSSVFDLPVVKRANVSEPLLTLLGATASRQMSKATVVRPLARNQSQPYGELERLACGYQPVEKVVPDGPPFPSSHSIRIRSLRDARGHARLKSRPSCPRRSSARNSTMCTPTSRCEEAIG